MEHFIHNFPSFSILMTLMAGMVTPFIRNGRVSQKINFGVIVVVGAMNAILFGQLLSTGESYTYMMGHFPAPWGNELRAGPLESLLATLFCAVMALSILGGLKDIYSDVRRKKQYLYFLMMNLLLASLLALIYTNDMFTAYVFIEINTIAACAIVCIKEGGPTLVATIRYMIMSMLGSGIFLFGTCILYNLTGHLLMSNIQEVVLKLYESGEATVPITILLAMMVIGLATKSAVYPFHSWLPGAHGSSTSSSSAILSGLVLKGYLILLIKIIYRVFSPEMFSQLHINDVIIVFGIASMIMGSVLALKEKHIKRMIAYSSVAQIGYIFMGIGIGTPIGLLAAIYHMLAHAFTKPMLFLSAGSLVGVSGHSYNMKDLKGAGRQRPLAGIAFTVGSLSMIGIPLFAGFFPKVVFVTSVLETDWFRIIAVMLALAVSTALNALYYLPLCINLWTSKKEEAHGHGHDDHGAHDAHDSHEVHAAAPAEEAVVEHHHPKQRMGISFIASMVLFIACNFALGVLYEPLSKMIEAGIKLIG